MDKRGCSTRERKNSSFLSLRIHTRITEEEGEEVIVVVDVATGVEGEEDTVHKREAKRRRITLILSVIISKEGTLCLRLS